MQILIVKTSSLGDVVHTLPALSDAARALPGLRCDWLVEAAYAEIPAWHPAVRRVVACDLRRWRRRPLHTWFSGEWGRFRAELGQTQYDLVLDAQGLLKSAVLARLAHGPLAGPDRASAREPLAARFYQRHYPVPARTQAHAVERTRQLFAAALGYAPPSAAPDAGLDRGRFPQPDFAKPYAVFLHGTTWPAKRWPRERWIETGRWLAGRGLAVMLPWGDEAERTEAEAIAAGCAGQVLPRLSLTELARWLAHARVCLGVDTGLAHLAAALGTPQISLYGPTLPRLTGAVGANQVWLSSGADDHIDRARPNTVAVAAVTSKLVEMV